MVLFPIGCSSTNTANIDACHETGKPKLTEFRILLVGVVAGAVACVRGQQAWNCGRDDDQQMFEMSESKRKRKRNQTSQSTSAACWCWWNQVERDMDTQWRISCHYLF